ncbi:LuxR C-terminal-related transcriptional regulator [Nocardia sp. BSTN01]|uniref:LuxR C-terminal-related transcriptional regulator n=1 Tax=Nocardia sp. BSTN01 TaxID=2783665 RepID=UPI002814A666|nr:LuxR C-terminal-related transcriptional regulator [Nocardia sp. BSTN01]
MLGVAGHRAGQQVAVAGLGAVHRVEQPRGVAHGAGDGEIARTLRIGASTVATHVEAILRRRGPSNRTAAAVYATRIGLCRSA